MPAVNFSPIFNGWQGFTPTGLPLNGGFVYTYIAGTNTPLSTYTTNAGNITNSNPIQLQADGRPPQEIWLDAGFAYKFVLTDSLSNQIGTYDNITGIDNSQPAALSQWVVTGLTPSYVNATTFTLAGDQTATFQIGRRVRYTLASGFRTGSITNSVFGALTIVTIVADSVGLDATLSAVDVGFLTSLLPSVPSVFLSPLSAPSISSAGVLSAGGALTVGGAATVGGASTLTGLVSALAGVKLGNPGVSTLSVYDTTVQFTPGLTLGGGSTGMTFSVPNTRGRGILVGQIFLFVLSVRLTAKGSSTGAVQVTNMPYTFSNWANELPLSIHGTGFTGLTGAVSSLLPTGSSTISLTQWSSTGTASITDTNVTNSLDIYISGAYRVI